MRTIHILIISIFLMVALGAPVASGAGTVRVATKENAVREQCRFFAPVVVKVQYGDPLEVTSTEGDWLRVRFEEDEGCIHKSAITEKKIKIKRSVSEKSEPSGGTSHEEVALAGKGFNPAVEEQYKLQNPEMDFAAIDDIEGYTVSQESLAEFIEEGGLKEPK
jgi:hypothetical protein